MLATAFAALAFFVARPAGAAPVADHLRGRILLDVERGGEAWYVAPLPAERHFLGRPDDAFRIMTALGLGVSDRDLARIPRESDAFAGDVALRERLAGRILLQVESAGEAWYVHPVDKKRYSLGRPAEAFDVMRRTSLGATTADIAAVPEAGTPAPPASVAHGAPFAAQAPLGGWYDRRQQEGCEEASALMAVRWARREPLTLAEAEREIVAMADWQRLTYGSHEDTSARDTAERIVKGYLGHQGAEVREGVGVDDIYRALRDGNVVAVPVNGRLLANPYFGVPGPLRHMVLVTGYDAESDVFIVNEPGTVRGDSFRYARASFGSALMDYPSGFHAPLYTDGRTAMIVIAPESK